MQTILLIFWRRNNEVIWRRDVRERRSWEFTFTDKLSPVCLHFPVESLSSFFTSTIHLTATDNTAATATCSSVSALAASHTFW
ncbi:hypothetical protein E2C01_017301 [Portunus trituberculatus]|uniref:Uncharacterized protein n=1 Tax=Portunus trituberculatus TaxID=210409 RepID=A0A5B7DT07_PORTR|nr:hypothetical protein [Portunus trituberculatus]